MHLWYRKRKTADGRVIDALETIGISVLMGGKI